MDNYTEFRPVQRTDWYIGFTHTGEAKNVKKSRPGSRSVQFLKLPLQEDRQVVKPDHSIQQIFEMLERLMDSRSQRSNSWWWTQHGRLVSHLSMVTMDTRWIGAADVIGSSLQIVWWCFILVQTYKLVQKYVYVYRDVTIFLYEEG